MAQFTIGAHELGEVLPSDFQEYISVVSGRSIISGADWGFDRVEFGVSGDGMIRIFWTPSGLHVNFISTTNPGEIPPLMVQVATDGARVPARVIELRLRALRNLYAFVHLASTDRTAELAVELGRNPNVDLEDLLAPEEQLFLEGLAPGSWIVTLWCKTKASYSSILKAVFMVYERGRDATLRKLEAEARLKELDVEAMEFQLMTKRLDYGLGLADKVQDPELKAVVRTRVETELSRLLSNERDSPEVQGASHRLLNSGERR